MRAPLVLLLLLLLSGPAARSAAPDTRETVVLMPGVAMPALIMHRIATSLEEQGYRVVSIGYPSRTETFEKIASDYLPARLAAAGVADATRLHFVAHSMGGLVLRLYLRNHRPQNLGRVVMLGPPNHGSTAADHAAEHSILRLVVGRNLGRLGTGPDAIANSLGPADFELGIIAGSRSNNPLSSRWLGATPNDGAVTVASARLEGARDFLVVPYSHTPMLWHREVITQVAAFLRTGHFQHPSPP